MRKKTIHYLPILVSVLKSTAVEGEVEEEERTTGVVPEEETGFRQQSGKVTCIVCGLTRNTTSQMTKHMEIHKEEGQFVAAGQIHCGLTTFHNCPFQCYSNEELMKHIETDHKKHKCNFCSQTSNDCGRHIKRQSNRREEVQNHWATPTTIHRSGLTTCGGVRHLTRRRSS